MFIVLDTETTGLYPNRHEMISFAGIKLDANLNEIDRLHIRIKPQNIQGADPKALEVNGYTHNDWRDAVDPKEAAYIIAKFMRDCIPVAHNWPFDRGFILSHLSRYAPDQKILRRGIDTVSLASAALMPHGYKSMSMETIAAAFGWPKQTHEALDDTLMCVQLFRLLYPFGIRATIKVHILLYRAKIDLYLNPLSNKNAKL
jgi:DNA polymerase-3 subunit epsilon